MQRISFSCLSVNCARLLSYTIYHFHPHLHCQTCEEHLFLLSRQKRMSIPLKCFTHPWIHSSHIFHFSSRVRSHFCISSNSIGKIISKRIERTAIKSTRCLCILYICADCYWLNWFNAIHSDSYERRISKCLYSEVHVAVTQIHRIYVAHPRDNTNYDLHFPKNQLHLSAFQATMRVILTIYRNNRNVSTLGITLSESGEFVRSKVSPFFRFFLWI